MKGKLKIIVKNERIFSRTAGFGGIFNIVRKMPVNFVLNGTVHKLKAQKEAYEFELDSDVEHIIEFIDPRRTSKEVSNKVAFWAYRLALRLGLALIMNFFVFGGNTPSSLTPSESGYTITIAEGDELTLCCRANWKGEVIVTTPK